MKKQETNRVDAYFDTDVDFSSESKSGDVITLESLIQGTDLDRTKEPPKETLEIETTTPTDEGVDPLEELVEPEVKNTKKESKEGKGDITTEVKEGEKEKDKVLEDFIDKGVDYKSIVGNLIKDGILSEIEGFEDEDGNVINFDDVEVDEDLFKSIIVDRISEIKEEASKDKISTNEISDFTKRIIEIDKQGGDVTSALKAYNNFKNPIDNLNLEEEADQEAALYMKYSAKELSDSEISRMIKGYKQDGVLKDEAERAVEDINKAFDAHLKALETQAEERKEQRSKVLKQYETDFKTALNSKFELDKGIAKKIIDIAAKENKEGRFDIDGFYAEFRKDPEKSAELALYFLDREEFIKQITSKKLKEDKLQTFKTIKMIPKKRRSNITIKEQEKQDKGLIDLKSIYETNK